MEIISCSGFTVSLLNFIIIFIICVDIFHFLLFFIAIFWQSFVVEND